MKEATINRTSSAGTHHGGGGRTEFLIERVSERASEKVSKSISVKEEKGD